MSKIEWTDETWNPITGCTKISEGCRNCYAEPMAKRLEAMGHIKYQEGFDKVVCHEKVLEEPLKRKKPCKIFVCSMADLFHDDVPFSFIDKIFETMEKCPQHTFIVLTKRPERMYDYFSLTSEVDVDNIKNFKLKPLKNVWLGVTADNQEQADKRIPILLEIPAAKRFVSIEPMLGAIDLTMINTIYLHNSYSIKLNALNGAYNIIDGYKNPEHHTCNKLDWVIVGGESGKNARPMHPKWVKWIKEDCEAAETPFFFKQWGEWEHCKQYKTFEEIQKNRHKYQTIASDDIEPLSVDKIVMMEKVGKKKAGRLLDGKEYSESPK